MTDGERRIHDELLDAYTSIRILRGRITELSHPAQTITELRATINKQDKKITWFHGDMNRNDKIRLDQRAKITEQAGESEIWARKLEAQASVIRELLDNNKRLTREVAERDWTIEEYRKRFVIMEGKVEDLTPECEKCGGDKKVTYTGCNSCCHSTLEAAKAAGKDVS